MALAHKPNAVRTVASTPSHLPPELLPEFSAKLLSIDPALAQWRNEVNRRWADVVEALSRRDADFVKQLNS